MNLNTRLAVLWGKNKVLKNSTAIIGMPAYMSLL
jgi:hypothetical protein